MKISLLARVWPVLFFFIRLVFDGKLVRGKCVPALEGGGELTEYKQGWWF